MKKENKISIHHFLTDPIFVTPEPESILEDTQGENHKKVLVVCQDTEANPELLGLLKKILGAVQLDIDKDITLLRAKKGTSYSFIGARTKIAFERMLVFGLPPTQLGLNIQTQTYAIITIENCQLLFSDALTLIASDKRLKAALWSNLQLLFPKT